MATLALITLPLAGHINPMMEAARALRRAGHRPVVVGPLDLLSRLPEDIDTHVIGERDWPRGSLDGACACLSRMSSLSDMRSLFGLVAQLSQLYIDHLPAAVDALGASAVLHDQLEPGAGIVARGLASQGIRHISLACALPMNREASVPPPFMGWRYNPSRYGRWLNGGYYTVVNALLSQQGRVLEAGAERFGLAKPEHNPDGSALEDWQQAWSVQDGISEDCDLAQGLASLDFPRERPPLYLGGFRAEHCPFPGLDAIDAERDGRPLCFISLGTLMGGRAKLLRTMARAATARGLQPVIVHAGRLSDTSGFAPGTILRPYLDQRAVMAESAAALIHGGYNSTTDAVASGLPLITLPIAFEQAAIAARVERAQLGRVVGRKGPALAQRINLGLGDAMRDADMRMASRRAQFEAMAAPGVSGLSRAVNAVLAGQDVSGRDPVSVSNPVPAYEFIPAE